MRRALFSLLVVVGASGGISVSVAHAETHVVSSTQCAEVAGSKAPFMLILKRGEEINDAVKRCLAAAKVKGAAVTGLGAVEDPQLGYFQLQKKEFLRKRFKGIYEVLAITGNLSTDGKELIPHLHVSLGKRNFDVIGGHLFEGKVGITLELVITPMGEMPYRKMDEEIGLNLIAP